MESIIDLQSFFSSQNPQYVTLKLPYTTECRGCSKSCKNESVQVNAIEEAKIKDPRFAEAKDEPILSEDSKSYTLRPRDMGLWKLYVQQKKAIWIPESIDLSTDLKDWDRLSDNERYFIKHVLAFFAASDGIVNENLAENMYQYITIPEAKCFYGLQIAMENIHSETYADLLNTYVPDEAERNQLFNAIETLPAISKKANWALKWIGDKTKTFREILFAFSVVEGVFFSASFCAIFWLKKRGLMKGLVTSNEYISRDEGLHCKFAIELMKRLKTQISYERAREIIIEAVNIEREFITEALPAALLGMNNQAMSQYVEYVADYIMQCYGFEPVYGVENPFDWMVMISLQNKTNFFESRPTEYQLAQISDGRFDLDTDF